MTGKERVLKLLKRGAFTDDEIAKILNMNPSSARTRRHELEKEGLVWPCDLTLTKAGRKTYVWTADHNGIQQST